MVEDFNFFIIWNCSVLLCSLLGQLIKMSYFFKVNSYINIINNDI